MELLSWVVYIVFGIAGAIGFRNTFKGYNDREHDKHYSTRKEARVMLYKLIGWAVFGVVMWTLAIWLSVLIEPN